VIESVVLGGLGSVSGSILAAVLLTVLPEALRSAQELRMVLYSLMIIVLMITRPGGLLGSREIDFRRWFRRPRASAA
jgi:branched-chain amino acid transport system permease protein